MLQTGITNNNIDRATAGTNRCTALSETLTYIHTGSTTGTAASISTTA